jgi:hypothetical protein
MGEIHAVSLVDDLCYMMMDPTADWYQDPNDTADEGDVCMHVQLMNPLFDRYIEMGGDCEEFHDALPEVPMTEDDPGYNDNPGDTYWDHYCHWIRTKLNVNDEELQKLKPFFCWIPVETIQRTLEATIQHVRAVSNYPMMKQMVAGFKFLCLHRLNDVASGDETFSTIQAHDRSNGAMIYYGCVSRMINFYGMTAKSWLLKRTRNMFRMNEYHQYFIGMVPRNNKVNPFFTSITNFWSRIPSVNGIIVAQWVVYIVSNPSVDTQMESTKKYLVGFFDGQGFIL